jgi:5-methylcytosine-specific restriction endonuclease McrA
MNIQLTEANILLNASEHRMHKIQYYFLRNTDENKAYHQQWVKDNPDKVVAAQKKYNRTHKEKRNAYSKLYHETHKTESKQYAKDYAKTHADELKKYEQSEEVQAYRKLYRASDKHKAYFHTEEYKKHRKEYEHSEKYKNYRKIYEPVVDRRRKLLIKDGDLTQNQWLEIRNKSPLCPMCGRFIECENLTLDHIIPLQPVKGKNGKHTKDNIQALCKSCNSSKNNRVPDMAVV